MRTRTLPFDIHEVFNMARRSYAPCDPNQEAEADDFTDDGSLWPSRRRFMALRSQRKNRQLSEAILQEQMIL